MSATLAAPSTEGKAYLRVNEICTRWGVGRNTVYNLIAAGKLPAVKILGCRRVALKDVEAFEATLSENGGI